MQASQIPQETKWIHMFLSQKKSPGRPGRAQKDQVEVKPSPQTPASNRRSGRSHKHEKIKEEIKPSVTNKRTRQSNKVDVTESEDKNQILEDDMGEKEEIQKLPEATQSDADSSLTLSRRGRKPKTNISIAHSDLIQDIGRVTPPASISEKEAGPKSEECTDGDNANKSLAE